MDKRKKYHFKTRFDIPLYNAMVQIAKKLNIPVYCLVQKALVRLLDDYRKGHTSFEEISDFLKRTDMDKKEYYAVFKYEPKERMRRLAFTFHISQAEVLRVALEYYIYVVYEAEGQKIIEIYKEKNHHEFVELAIGLVLYELFTTKSQSFKMIDKTSPYKCTVF